MKTALYLIVSWSVLTNFPRTVLGQGEFPHDDMSHNLAFIEPNEGDPYVFRLPKFQEGGVYLGVGSFRTLAAAAFADFDEIFQTDNNLYVYLFNLQNNKMIADSPTRMEYLEKRFRLPKGSSLLDGIDKGLSESRHLSYVLATSDVLDDVLSDTLNPYALFRIRRRLLRSKRAWQSHIFGSDQLYQKVRSMILSDKIKPVLLDWTSESRALPAIINYLNNTSQMVNVVDLSNMLEWTYSDDSLRQLAANLRTIPTHMDAVVLSTDAYSPGTYYRGWTYTVRYLDLFADMIARPNWQDHLAEPGGILRKNCWMTWLGLQ